jgi:uncharacterized protein YbbC (DUF1343 family)
MTVGPMSAVTLPIDRLPDLWPANLRGAKIGAVLHPASISATLIHSAKVLESFNGHLVYLSALFGPQHGFRSEDEDNMTNGKVTDIPAWGSHPQPLRREPRTNRRDAGRA